MQNVVQEIWFMYFFNISLLKSQLVLITHTSLQLNQNYQENSCSVVEEVSHFNKKISKITKLLRTIKQIPNCAIIALRQNL